MFCKNCGSQLPDGATKCENCGQEITQEPAQETKKMPKVDAKEFINKNKKAVQIAAVAAVVLIVAVILIATKKTTVNLNKYVTVSFSGYDTVGRASYEFDEVAFRKDYRNKIKLSTKQLKELKELGDLYSYLSGDDYCDLLLSLCVSGSLDQSYDLSNGDKVEYQWDCKDDIAKEYFKVKLKYSDIKAKVEGLEEAKVIDPFESVKLVYTGISPNGSARIENSSSDKVIKNLYYGVEPGNGLKNGDKVVVKVNNAEDDNYYVENYGVILSETEKEYTVEGLDCYAQSSSEIPDEIMDKMKKQAEDCFYSQTTEWVSEIKVSSIDYIGNYFLKPKFADGYNSYNNCIYLVYKVDTDYENEFHQENLSFYYYVQFTNIMILADGTCSVDLSSYTAPTNWNGFSHDYKWGDNWDEKATLNFPGYEDLDSLFNKLITAVVSDYEYEDNVKE